MTPDSTQAQIRFANTSSLGEHPLMNPHTITETPHVPTPGTRAPHFNSTHTTPYLALPSTVRGAERTGLRHHNTLACHSTAKHDSWAVTPCHPKACMHPTGHAYLTPPVHHTHRSTQGRRTGKGAPRTSLLRQGSSETLYFYF